jgi:hypothetical protein
MTTGAGPPPAGLAVTVLGSGGPFVNPRRASSSYLLWLDGRPRILVDAGGGAFERLGRVGVDPIELDVLLTHLHIDHSGGLAPVVFAAWMAGRAWPLPVAGPAGDGEQPGVDRFAELLFGVDGAWSYLHSFDGFGIDASPCPSDPEASAVTSVIELDELRVSSVAVPHGMMPTVAYRIDAGDESVTVSGDVQGLHPPLAELARGTSPAGARHGAARTRRPARAPARQALRGRSARRGRRPVDTAALPRDARAGGRTRRRRTTDPAGLRRPGGVGRAPSHRACPGHMSGTSAPRTGWV